MKRFCLALLFSLLIGPASAQLSGGLMFPGPGTAHTTGGGGYTGPGDVQTFLVWGSVARVYNAASASTATQLADLVDSSAPTTVICTLRGTTAGTVDLVGTYCTGSVTPATKCAAATGGVCNVSKLYDQIGGTGGWTQATASQQPVLTFSAINSLPAMTFVAANSRILKNATGVTQAVPFTMMVVAERTANFTTQMEIMASTVNDVEFQFDGVASQARIYAGGASIAQASATDSAFHVIQATVNTAVTGTLNVDGVGQATGTTGTNSLSGNVSIGGYLTSIFLDGQVAEVGIYAGTYNASVQSNTRTQYGL